MTAVIKFLAEKAQSKESENMDNAFTSQSNTLYSITLDSWIKQIRIIIIMGTN